MSQAVPEAARNRRARNSLTIEAILDAAEKVATTGFDALTIRAVATELQSSPMALYRYFATKDELVDALLDRVLGRFELAPETGSWLEDLRNFALNHRRLLMDHPWAVAPLTGHPNPGPSALPIGEAALRIIRRAGIAGDRAVATFSGIVALNYGWSSFIVARPADGRSVDSPRPIASLYPLTAEVSDAMSRYGSDEHYEFALGQLLAGIQHEGQV